MAPNNRWRWTARPRRPPATGPSALQTQHPMPMHVPAFDDHGLRTPGGVEALAVVKAKAAVLQAQHGGRGRDAVRREDQLQAFEPGNVGATREQDGCRHAQGSFGWP